MNDEEDGRRAFDRLWAPLIGLGVLLAFVVQQISPYINPMLIVGFVVPSGFLYIQSYLIIVSGRRFNGALLYVYAIFGLIAIASGVLGAAQSLGTIREISGPCAKLRKTLLDAPNSEAADTYSALHCPVYLPAYHWP